MSLIKTSFVGFIALFLFGISISSCTKQKGFFSKQLSSIDEPQTDDERTLNGEYQDYLKLVDSLAEVWDGKDTLSMRRLYYNQREQERRVAKVLKFQNIRKSLADAVENNIDIVIKGIYDKFTPELCNELYNFHVCFDLDKYFHSSIDPSNLLDNKTYVNSYGERYFLEKGTIYKHIGKDAWPEKIDCVIKHPLREEDVMWFKEFCKRYHISSTTKDDYVVGDGSPTRYAHISDEDIELDNTIVHEASETDWDATEIDWCEECANKNYSCCPKCKNGEEKDCACGCEMCHEIWEYNNI